MHMPGVADSPGEGPMLVGRAKSHLCHMVLVYLAERYLSQNN